MKSAIAICMMWLGWIGLAGCHSNQAPDIPVRHSDASATALADRVPMLLYLEMAESGAFEAFRRFPWAEWLNPYLKTIGSTEPIKQRPDEIIALYLWGASPRVGDADVLPNFASPAYPHDPRAQASLLEQAGLFPEAMAISPSGSTPFGSPNQSDPYATQPPFGAPQVTNPAGAFPPTPAGSLPSSSPYPGSGLDFRQPGSVY